MDTFTLNCWVRSQDARGIFQVKISKKETVAALKEAIKNKKPAAFRDVDADGLNLYKPRDPLPRPYKENLSKFVLSEHGEPLEMAVDELSKVFPEPPPKYHIHIIVDAASTIVCWLRGDTLDASVELSIRPGASERTSQLIHHVKDAQPNLRNFADNHIRLYRISGDEKQLQESLNQRGDGELLRGDTLLPHFLGVPVLDRLCVVVEVATERAGLTGPTTSHKREHPEDPFEAIKRIRRRFATLPMLAPSMIATPSSFRAHYQGKKEPELYCGRPQENQSRFPLVLAHPVFAIFISECKTYEPSDEDLMFIVKLSQRMRQLFEDEVDRRTQFRVCMREYGISLTESKIEGTEYTTDGDARVGALPYLISEAKKNFGASRGDPYIQAAAYHLAATQSWLLAHPDELRPLPCIHIFYNGPVLGFAGSMLTEKFDVNVLGPMLPLFYHPMDIDLQIHCAKMFGALKTSVAALKEYYEKTVPQSPSDTRFPWITEYDPITPLTGSLRFQYLQRMDGGNLLYICQHIHDKKRILVKFVRTYSKDAHLASAAKDGAPTLLGHRDVQSCGWFVVVMELLEKPDWVSGVEIVDKAAQRAVRDKVKEHVSTLHQQGFVHGDIRPQNVLVKHDTLSVRLVDFDWAGETNKVKYPFLVNPDIGYGFKRPSGVKGGAIITTEHDLAMVNLMYPCLS